VTKFKAHTHYVGIICTTKYHSSNAYGVYWEKKEKERKEEKTVTHDSVFL